jgi:hypothetical protein
MTATRPLEELIYELEPDPWRKDHPFSPEMNAFQTRLFDPTISRGDKAAIVTEWLASTHYPCLFGRKSAKAGSLSVVVLEERDLFKSDGNIRAILSDARTAWRTQALRGGQHALVLLAVSERLANARLDPTLLEINRRLCELYLEMPVQPDLVFRDELFLQIADDPGDRIRWEVGVDNFAAQGDGRWWHDHRIPGGIGFSMNSVGHMVRSMVENALAADSDLREQAAALTRDKLIQFALPMAMRTILFAQEKSRIPGTRLRKRNAAARSSIDDQELNRAAAMKGVTEWDETLYEGWYHTDHSVRTDFFDPEAERRSSPWNLDFTYLHAESELDYKAMSLGERILAILKA